MAKDPMVRDVIRSTAITLRCGSCVIACKVPPLECPYTGGVCAYAVVSTKPLVRVDFSSDTP